MNALVQHIMSLLEDVYDRREAEAMAWWVAEETTGLSRTQLICDCKITTFSPYMQEVVDRLRHFEPIQYIFGHTEWGGLDLRVTPHTLIPRPETAELVERINEHMANEPMTDGPVQVLDIGTGSGCIALALKKAHPDWTVTGMDISPKAIETARENARRNKLEVNFQVADIFDFNGENHTSDIINRKYDLVVSNPPYIRESEKTGMRPNVLDFEPASALFVPDSDPLLFYRRIARLHLGRFLFFEINEALPSETAEMLRDEDYTDIAIYQDCYGKPRFISCRMA